MGGTAHSVWYEKHLSVAGTTFELTVLWLNSPKELNVKKKKKQSAMRCVDHILTGEGLLTSFVHALSLCLSQRRSTVPLFLFTVKSSKWLALLLSYSSSALVN